MKWEIFEVEIKRLETNYRSSNMTTDRVKLIWDIVQNISDNSFKSFVSRWIVDKKTAPTGEDFRTFVATQKRLTLVSTAPYSSNCSRCGGEGLCVAQNKQSKYQAAFLCECEAGHKSHWNYPKKVAGDQALYIGKWKDANKEEWVLI